MFTEAYTVTAASRLSQMFDLPFCPFFILNFSIHINHFYFAAFSQLTSLMKGVDYVGIGMLVGVLFDGWKSRS